MNQKAFYVGCQVMFQNPINNNMEHDEIIYISKYTIQGKKWDLTWLYKKGKLIQQQTK